MIHAIKSQLTPKAGAPVEVLGPESLEERLARLLHAKMEHLDPTGKPVWEGLTEREREFYRCCVDTILCSGLIVPTKG
jgi:hypothetical protein